MFLRMGNEILLYHITKEYIDGCAFGRILDDTGLAKFYLNNLYLLKNLFNFLKEAQETSLMFVLTSKPWSFLFIKNSVLLSLVQKK